MPTTVSATTPLQISQKMKAWLLGRPNELKRVEKPVSQPHECIDDAIKVVLKM